MKTLLKLLLVLSLAAVVSCSRDTAPEKTLADEYDFIKKEAYIQLSQIENKMLQLEIKMKRAQKKIKKELKEEYQELIDEKKELEKDLSAASSMSDRKWRDFKSRIGPRLTELANKIDEIIES